MKMATGGQPSSPISSKFKPAEKKEVSHEQWFSSERRVENSQGEIGPIRFYCRNSGLGG